MALAGQLSDFNLAEIMQLLASQQKSGFLNLETRREMVFVFDKGMLISTRDRRSRSQDPLEIYLKAYGYFTDEEWNHIEYVQEHSSLDLTEILISEGMLGEQELTDALRGLAQEMTVLGMQLKRGRYNFNPTQDTPPGVKWKLRLDVQGLLMEAARRLDEESQLREFFPNQGITFSQGQKVPPPEMLGETGTRIMELALAGMSLGRIIRQGRCESFVVRDMLKNWCGEGYLKKIEADAADDGEDDTRRQDRRRWSRLALRSAPLTLLVILMLTGLGWLRWTALPPADVNLGHALREQQLQDEVVQAALLYRYAHGTWPGDLQTMVEEGELPASTKATIEALGWAYKPDPDRKRFSLG